MAESSVWGNVHGVPLLVRHLVNHSIPSEASIIDENIDLSSVNAPAIAATQTAGNYLAKSLERLGHNLITISGVHDIPSNHDGAATGRRYGGSGVLGLCCINVANSDGGTVLGEKQSSGSTNPLATSGDNGNLALQHAAAAAGGGSWAHHVAGNTRNSRSC